MSAYDRDPRVHVNAWGRDDREVTYTVSAEYVPATPPPSDVDWSGYGPGDEIVVKFIQDGGHVYGWVVEADGEDRTTRLTDWGAYVSADAALAVVLGEPQ